MHARQALHWSKRDASAARLRKEPQVVHDATNGTMHAKEVSAVVCCAHHKVDAVIESGVANANAVDGRVQQVAPVVADVQPLHAQSLFETPEAAQQAVVV